MKYIHYSVGNQTISNYEAVYRTTTKEKNLAIDGVEVIPIIKYKDAQDQIVLIANFRPPVGKFCL